MHSQVSPFSEGSLAQRNVASFPYLVSSPRSEAVLTQALNFLPRYLLEQRDVEVNVRDKWDSTPL